jgi:hypothetical protein
MIEKDDRSGIQASYLLDGLPFTGMSSECVVIGKSITVLKRDPE